MSVWESRKIPILDIIGKDGPIWKEMQKPQIMYVRSKDYGVKKMWARHKENKDRDKGRHR